MKNIDHNPEKYINLNIEQNKNQKFNVKFSDNKKLFRFKHENFLQNKKQYYIKGHILNYTNNDIKNFIQTSTQQQY